MNQIFIDGTNGEWRDKLTSNLKVPYSETDKEGSDYHLYYVDSRFRNIAVIAKIIESSMNDKIGTIMVIQTMGLSEMFVKNLIEVGEIAKKYGALVLKDSPVHRLADVINKL